jgi:hypothetical protein
MTAASKTKTRIYAVTRRQVTEGATRLVRATSPAAALAYVAHDELDSELANQDDLYAAAKVGIAIEEPINSETAPPKPVVVDDGQADIEDVGKPDAVDATVESL